MVPDPREAHLDRLEIWLVVWTSVVVVGLIVEYFEEVPKVKEHFKGLKKFDWTISEGRPVLKYGWFVHRRDVIKLAAIIGAILVTLGVGGELYIDAISSRIEHDLRTDADLTIARLQTDAKVANARAADAMQNAERSKLATQELEATNLRLKRALQPRRIAYFQGPKGTFEGAACSIQTRLAATFRGLRVFVQADLSDKETRKFTQRFLELIQALGGQSKMLESSDTGITSEMIDDGIAVYAWGQPFPNPSNREIPLLSPDDAKAVGALDLLMRFLVFSDIIISVEEMAPGFSSDGPAESPIFEYPSFKFNIPHGALLALIGDEESADERLTEMASIDSATKTEVDVGSLDNKEACPGLTIPGIALTPSAPSRYVPPPPK
jgi:hypothetical protein